LGIEKRFLNEEGKTMNESERFLCEIRDMGHSAQVRKTKKGKEVFHYWEDSQGSHSETKTFSV
jgi:hypothetical protein